jgi:two-component system, OmpR family, sensor kinase
MTRVASSLLERSIGGSALTPNGVNVPASLSIFEADHVNDASSAGVRTAGRRTAADELLTIAAHDIRNYLTPMRGRAALLRRRAIREDRQADTRDFEALERSIERLNLLVGNLLDTARLDTGLFRMSMRRVDLVELARETADYMQNGTVTVRVEAPTASLVVMADPERVRQVLENLVANAVRYSPDDGTVLIRLARKAAGNEQWVTVAIDDQGPGVPAELLPHLFAPLHVGPGSVGLGLGLYLAREIARAHGGSLAVEAPPGGGARLILILPDCPSLDRDEDNQTSPHTTQACHS